MSKSKIFHSGRGEDNKHAYHSPLEIKVKGLLTPFQHYINSQATASIFLFACTLIALVWASIPALSIWYERFVTAPIGFHIAKLAVNEPLQFWVNDVLLTFFFFFVGLEIKREFLVGELTNHKSAIFVLFSAVGGMVLPASIYFILNMGTHDQLGWGIPMATDTAFALGIVACFKGKLPKGVFTFLAALAILDDIGAIIAIAVFYTSQLQVNLLLIALLLTILLILLNYCGFRKPWPYIIIGLLIWGAIEGAGIHGTISGILVAFIIPARPEQGPKQFVERVRTLLNYFEKRKSETALILQDQKQHDALEQVQQITQQATTPLQRWESKLELPIALLILPLFALVNAGVPISLHLMGRVFTHSVSLGIILGLVVGKPLGVLIFGWVAIRCNLGSMPESTSIRQIIGVAVLTGIGFTMSLFISNLSFTDANTLLLAKAAIQIGSVCAAIVGILYIMLFS